MSPEMRLRIVGVNETSPAFRQAVDDAQAAARKIKASGELAGSGMRAAAARSQNLLFQLNDIGVSLASGQNPLLVMVQQGSQIAGIYGGRNGGVGAAFRDLSGFAVKLAPLAAVVALIGVGVAGLTTEINKSQKAHVSFFNVLGGSWDLALGAFHRFADPTTGWFANLWPTISPYVSDTTVGMVQMFDLAYLDIKTIFTSLPAAMGDVMIQMVNEVIKGANSMITKALDGVNGFLQNPGVMFLLGGLGAHDIPTFGFQKMDELPNPLAGANDRTAAEFGANLTHVNSFDYLGMFGDAASKNALTKADDSAKGLGKTIRGPLTDGIDKLTAKTSAFADAATSAFSNLGSTIIDAFRGGGNVALNVLDALLNKVGQFGENLVNSGLNSLLGNIVGSAFSPATGGTLGAGLWGSAIFNAKGGVYAGNGISAFSSSVIDRPTVFPFAKGVGMMGEAGPEAIMPLRRGSDGKLGVAVANGGGHTFHFSLDLRGAQQGVGEQIEQWARMQLPGLVRKAVKDPYAVGA